MFRECRKIQRQKRIFKKILKETVGQMENSTTLEGLEGIYVNFAVVYWKKVSIREKNGVWEEL